MICVANVNEGALWIHFLWRVGASSYSGLILGAFCGGGSCLSSN